MNRAEAARVASRAAADKLKSIPADVRIKENVEYVESGCWEWTGSRYTNGYAVISWQGKHKIAHRLSYEAFVGAIPEGMQIDHLCRNRACVNPEHLEAVTPRENTRRAMRSACVNGHAFVEPNTWMHRGKRYCRTCRRERMRVRRARLAGGAA